MTPEDIENRFAYHKPGSDETIEKHQLVRQEMALGADLFNNMLPECREKSLAITKLEEAMFWANAAIARHQ
jgi:hypothetical protein